MVRGAEWTDRHRALGGIEETRGAPDARHFEDFGRIKRWKDGGETVREKRFAASRRSLH